MLDNGLMKFLSSLAALFSGRPSAVSDIELEIVQFDPPDGSTLLAGEDIKITVQWRHAMRGRGIGIWTKPELPAGVGGGYEGDGGEAHAPGRGRVLRGVSVAEPARLEAVYLIAKDGDSRELFNRRVPVNFTFAVNPEREERRHDGAFSRITGVEVLAPAGELLPIGQHVQVRVGYYARSTHGIRVTAIPVTDADMRYAATAETSDGDGHAMQGFVIGQACVIRHLHVRLLNDSDVAVAEQMVEVDLRFG